MDYLTSVVKSFFDRVYTDPAAYVYIIVFWFLVFVTFILWLLRRDIYKFLLAVVIGSVLGYFLVPLVGGVNSFWAQVVVLVILFIVITYGSAGAVTSYPSLDMPKDGLNKAFIQAMLILFRRFVFVLLIIVIVYSLWKIDLFSFIYR